MPRTLFIGGELHEQVIHVELKNMKYPTSYTGSKTKYRIIRAAGDVFYVDKALSHDEMKNLYLNYIDKLNKRDE